MKPTEVPMDELERIAFETGALLIVDGVNFHLAAVVDGKYQEFTAHKPITHRPAVAS